MGLIGSLPNGGMGNTACCVLGHKPERRIRMRFPRDFFSAYSYLDVFWFFLLIASFKYRIRYSNYNYVYYSTHEQHCVEEFVLHQLRQCTVESQQHTAHQTCKVLPAPELSFSLYRDVCSCIHTLTHCKSNQKVQAL